MTNDKIQMSNKLIKVLAIETSCDETAAAVVAGFSGQPFEILGSALYSQIDLHRQYGGVFPEAASREHVKKIGPIIEETLKEAIKNSKHEIRSTKQISNSQIQNETSFGFRISDFGFADLQSYLKSEIDAIAVTQGPGLIGSLLVGVNTAKSLAYSFGKPLIPIHHHAGHIAAAWLQSSVEITNHKSQITNLPILPALALVVSGGHTRLVLVTEAGHQDIGRTRDDAAGEAYDKVARLLDLPYPGGPEISKLARQFIPPTPHNLNPTPSFKLPRPMLDSGDFNFSFSGLKTAVARVVAQEDDLTLEKKQAIAYEFQEAVVETLVAKTVAAATMHQPKSVIVAGGVASDPRLREVMTAAIGKLNIALHIPPPKLCTDNAAMIAAAALRKYFKNQVHNWYDVTANDNLALE